jgi:hypothetical protein
MIKIEECKLVCTKFNKWLFEITPETYNDLMQVCKDANLDGTIKCLLDETYGTQYTLSAHVPKPSDVAALNFVPNNEVETQGWYSAICDTKEWKFGDKKGMKFIIYLREKINKEDNKSAVEDIKQFLFNNTA